MKYKVDDRVCFVSNGSNELGSIIEVDDSDGMLPYLIRWDSAVSFDTHIAWAREDDIVLVEAGNEL